MDQHDHALCAHCGLPAGPWPTQREIEGASLTFCCYGCFLAQQINRGGGEETAAAGLLIRLGVSAFLAMNIMLFSLALYSGGIDGSEPGVRQIFHVVLWALATPVMIILGWPFARETIAELRHRRLSAAALVVLGAGAAYGYSVLSTLNGDEKVYFDTATMVLVLFTVGRFLEATGRARAVRNLTPLLHPLTQEVLVVEEGRDHRRSVSDIVAGSEIRILPGERIPADGIVAGGEGQVNTAWLTGESDPADVGPGSPVLAGTINLDGVLLVRCTGDVMATRWMAICTTIREALARQPRVQGITDACARVFVPLVILVAAATVAVFAVTLPFNEAMLRGLAVLVVACPCALGLAAPLSTAISLDLLAREGCIVRGGDILHTMAGVDVLAFDKTGTLTSGTARVVDISVDGASPEQVLAWSAALERHSHHPFAGGVIERATECNAPVLKTTGVRAIAAAGMVGTVAGDSVSIGRRSWFEEGGWTIPKALHDAADRQEGLHRSVVYVGRGRRVHGALAFDEMIRREARQTVDALNVMGVEPLMLSGDLAGATGLVANAVGIRHWRAALSPEQKSQAIAEQKAKGARVAMVGDGINDGPALAEADIGISVGSGIELARETAHVVLPGGGLEHLPRVLRVARVLRRTVKVNLVWAFSYNGVAMALAAGGLLQPILAASLMAGSSFIVIANSLRISHLSDASGGADAGRAQSRRASPVLP